MRGVGSDLLSECSSAGAWPDVRLMGPWEVEAPMVVSETPAREKIWLAFFIEEFPPCSSWENCDANESLVKEGKTKGWSREGNNIGSLNHLRCSSCKRPNCDLHLCFLLSNCQLRCFTFLAPPTLVAADILLSMRPLSLFYLSIHVCIQHPCFKLYLDH